MTCGRSPQQSPPPPVTEFLDSLSSLTTTTTTMSFKRSNVSLLTEGAKYIKRAKKAREEQVEEIKFDDSARQ